MIVHIIRDGGFVNAMGHRVALHLGGEPELKRRCLGTLAQLDAPPDEIRFELLEPPAAAIARPAEPEELAEREETEDATEPAPEPAPEPKRAAARPPPRRQKGKS